LLITAVDSGEGRIAASSIPKIDSDFRADAGIDARADAGAGQAA